MSLHPHPSLRALCAAPLLLALLAGPATPDQAGEDCDCGGDASPAAPSRNLSSDPQGLLSDGGPLGPDEPPRLDLFVMSLCPYGMEAELALAPLVARWGKEVKFRLHFIADEAGDSTATGSMPPASTAAAGVDAAAAVRRPGCATVSHTGREAETVGPFSSLHGQREVDEDRRQLVIAADHAEALLPYLACRAHRGPGSDWQTCARAVGLDANAIDLAARGPVGHRLLSANLRTANQLGVNLSPTLLIDGTEYDGRLDPFAVGRELCAGHPGAAPCLQWPACGRDDDCAGPEGMVSLCLNGDTPAARCEHRPPVAFGLHVLLADPQICPACDADRFLRSTLALFPGARVQRHPQGDGTARSLAQRYGAGQLPAYIISREFAHTARFERVQHLLVESGDAYTLRPRVVGTTYWPRRPHRPGRLDVFLPTTAFGAVAFGVGAAARRDLTVEDDILRLWSRRGEVPDLRLHYLPAAGDGGGASEEQLRRLCLQAHQPRRYAAYAAARSAQLQGTAVDSAWQSAAAIAGLSAADLARCATHGEGQRLQADLRARADSLSLRLDESSALVENRILFRNVQLEELSELWHSNCAR